MTTTDDFDAIVQKADGKEYTLDGVHGHIKVEWVRGYWPTMIHIPSPKGRNSEEYRRMRRYLGDDYTTEFDWQSPEFYKVLGLDPADVGLE